MRVTGARGYTLVELVVVVGIIALIAVVAVPQTFSDDEQRLQIAAVEFADAIRFARSETLHSGMSHGFTIDSGNRQLNLFRLHGSGGPIIIKPGEPYPPMYSESYAPPPGESYPTVYMTEVRHPVTKQPYRVDIAIHPFAKADSLYSNAKFYKSCSTANQVSFDSDGVARCFGSGGMALQSLELGLTLGNYKNEVRLDGLTGRVTVQ